MYCRSRRTQTVFAMLFCVVLCLAPSALLAEILGSTLVVGQTDFTNSGPHEGTAHVVFVGSGPGLFEELVFVPSDVSTVYEASSASDPDFDTFVEFATNGVADMLLILGGIEGMGRNGDGKTEQEWFNLSMPDFSGAVIEKITLQLQQLEFVDPNALGGVTVKYTFFIQVHGQVAVPVENSTWGAIKAIYNAQ